MFEKIIFATDLSPASDKVLQCINGLRQLGIREVILFHALGIRHLEELKHILIRAHEPHLAKQKNELEKFGFKTRIEIGAGTVSSEINKVVEKEKASMIVIGSHGEGLSFDDLLGSEATKIAHIATKPLLVIRLIPREKDAYKCEACEVDLSMPILYATDFSDTSYRAFSYLEKIVESGANQVTLLHVQDFARIEKHLKDRLEEFNRIDRERLEMLKTKLMEKGAGEVEILLPYGHPTEEILKESREKKYTMIVMGSQGRGFIKEIFLGSVSNNVLRHATIPVLLIPVLK